MRVMVAVVTDDECDRIVCPYNKDGHCVRKRLTGPPPNLYCFYRIQEHLKIDAWVTD